MSSGEMIADRRFDYGRDLAARGDLQGAADLFTQAIEGAPGFVSAWFALGDVRERLGDTNGAIAAFGQARAQHGVDLLGADLRLIRLTGTGLAAMTPQYVTTLYDQYAPTFERSLVGELGYCGPDLLVAAVSAVRVASERPMRFRRAIDLGCGTGLAAGAFRDRVAEFAGFDLSAGMIRQAQASGLYATLQVVDAVDGLRGEAGASADLVLAADMMIYLYNLAPLFGEVARVLAPGGLFAFTAETHDGDGVTLGAGLRYAQGAAHLRGLLADAGLVPERIDAASIRTENQLPVPSLVMVASKG
jgi:predicted TPR repeat methyltransferase